MNIQLIDIVNSISVFQLAFFSFYILKKSKATLSNRILLAFFIVQFLAIFNYVITNVLQSHLSVLNIACISCPLWFLWGPLMFFYIISQVQKGFRFKPIHLIHLLPFLFFSSAYFFFFGKLSLSEKALLFENGLFFKYVQMASFLMNLQVIAYNVASLLQLRKYQQELKQVNSSVKVQQLLWLKSVLYGYILACIINEVMFFSGSHIGFSMDIQQLLSHIAFMIFFNVLFYKAIINPHVFEPIDFKNETIANHVNIDFTFINDQLENFIKEQKPYLNQNLTLEELSKLVNIPERTISQVINQYRNQTFFTFINSYRIEEAKKLLSEKEAKKTTMLGIAFDSGFNSKSVFYEAFKKYVGMTPTEYRQLVV